MPTTSRSFPRKRESSLDPRLRGDERRSRIGEGRAEYRLPLRGKDLARATLASMARHDIKQRDNSFGAVSKRDGAKIDRTLAIAADPHA